MLGGFVRNAAHKWGEGSSLRGTSETETHTTTQSQQEQTNLLVELGNSVLSTILE
jgi:hypothetical protein